MSLKSRKQYLKVQILETKKMLELIGNDPYMSIGVKERLDDFEQELKDINELGDIREAKVQLLFSGNAVSGSQGIKADFIGSVVSAFQEMVKAEATMLNVGRLPKRGKIKDSKNSSLYLTSLPRGSFGIELTQIETENNLFAFNNMANAIDKVMNFIEESAKDEQSFETVSENLPSRSVKHLTKFFKHIAQENSILKIESGSREFQISENDVKSAFERVNATKVDEMEKEIIGNLRGILLDSGKFELSTENGEKVQGFINEDLTEEDLLSVSELLNKKCAFKVRIHSKHYSSGLDRETFELLEVTEIENNKLPFSL